MLVLVGVIEEVVALVEELCDQRGLAPPRVEPARPDVASLASLDPCLIVLGLRVEDPLRLARTIKASLPDAAILIRAPPERVAALQHEALLTPARGARLRVLPASRHEQAATQVLDEYGSAMLQREQRRVTESINRRLEASRPPDRPEAYLDELVSIAPFGIVLLSPTGAILSVNDRARELLRYDARAHPRLADLFPSEADRIAALVADAARRPFLRLRAPHGGDAWVELRAGPAVRRGEARVLVFVWDVTEATRNEALLEQARWSLARSDKLATMGELVGGVAHEIRTPLTILHNHLALLRLHLDRLGALPAELEIFPGLIAGAEDAADRIGRLVVDLRRHSRGKAGDPRPVSLSGAVAEALDLFERTGLRHIRIDRDLGGRRHAMADPFQVQQIVLNLVQNAADASAPGGRVRVTTRDEPDAVALLVEDEGVGMPPELKAKIFESFVTTKPTGSGLGLAIVRRIVEQHRGSIAVDTAPGKGSRFVVQFPLAGENDIAQFKPRDG